MKKDRPKTITGSVRVADRTGRFLRKPEPGSVLVVDLPDLDYQAGNLLVAYAPSVILNASSNATGRGLATGSELLLSAGIPIVDDLGSDVLELRDGDVVTVTGANVARRGDLIASGREFTLNEDVPNGSEETSAARARLAHRVESQALAAARDFETEGDLLVDGIGLPEARVKLRDRIALVATPSSDLAENRKQVRQFVGDNNPILIGAGTGVAALQAIGLQPQIVVADPRDLELGKLKKTRQVLVPSVGEEIPARDLLKRHSIVFDAVESNLTVTDLALLFAHNAGASAIVDCSRPESLSEAFDAPGVQVTGSMLVKAKLGAKLVSLAALLAVYRPRISGWWLALLFVAALASGLAAFFFTPLGDGLLDGVLGSAGQAETTAFPLTNGPSSLLEFELENSQLGFNPGEPNG